MLTPFPTYSTPPYYKFNQIKNICKFFSIFFKKKMRRNGDSDMTNDVEVLSIIYDDIISFLLGEEKIWKKD